MSTYGNLLTQVILRQTTSNGKLASGARLYFYQSGTSTPKQVWLDYACTTPASNPVVCDSSGYFGPLYGQGVYRLIVTDSTGAQIVPPVDGVIGQGGVGAGSVGGNATLGIVKTYDELRAVTQTYDYVLVAGRSADGDGGAGIFQFMPGGTLLDDDGITLVNTGSNIVWQRTLEGFIDPRWFGLAYDSLTSQVIPLNKAISASDTYNVPVRITGSVFVDSSITFDVGTSVVFDTGAIINSSYSTYVTINGASVIETAPFGGNIIAQFGPAYDEVRISYFVGTNDDDRLTKLYQAVQLGTNQVMVIDQALTLTSNVNLSSPVKFVGAGAMNINYGSLGGSILMYKMIEPDTIRKIIGITSTGAVAINLGQAARPEWFGAKADGTTNDSAAFAWATKTGSVLVQDGKTYKLSSAITYPTSLTITGNAVLNIVTNSINCTSLTLFNTSITYTGTGNWLNSTNFFAFNGSFPSTLVASGTKVINGCAYSDVAGAPVFAGSPTSYNTHLGDIVSAPALATDSTGKIIASSFSQLVMDGTVWRGHNSPRSYYVGDSNPYSNFRRASGIRYAGGRLWFLGENGYLFSSVDGVQPWLTNVGPNTGTQDSLPWFNNIVYANGWYLASTYRINGTTTRGLYRSTNGASFTPTAFQDPSYPAPVNSSCRSMFYDTTSSLWVAGDYGGRLMVSGDNGATWGSWQVKYYQSGSSGTQIYATAPFADGFVGKIDNTYILTNNQGQTFTNTNLGTDGWVMSDMGNGCRIYSIVKLDTGKYKMLGTTNTVGSSLGVPFAATANSLGQYDLGHPHSDQMPGFADINTNYSFVTDVCHYNGRSFITTGTYNTNLADQGKIYTCADGSNTWSVAPSVVSLSGWYSYPDGAGSGNNSLYVCGGNNMVFAVSASGIVLDTH